MASRFVLPFADVGSGITPQDGALLEFFITGTSTQKDTFSDEALTVPNTNPVVADANGVFPDIWLPDRARYKVTLDDKNIVQKFEADPVIGGLSSSSAKAALATVAAMTADADAILGDFITVEDYATGNGSGVLFFKWVAAATGTADGGSFIDHDTLSLQAQQNFPGKINVKSFGVTGDGVDSRPEIINAWTYVLANGKDMYFPAGTYNSVDGSMPMGRVDGSAPTSLLDCKNIVVFGDGRATILKTTSAAGADVLQINGAENFHVKNLSITADLTGSSGAGSNCLSVTGGGDNLTFENLFAFDPDFIDQTTFLDGGKGFSIQEFGFATNLGTIEFKDCIADGCVFGFDFTTKTEDLIGESAAIRMEGCVAENCWFGYIASIPAPASAIPAGFNSGLVMHGSAVNCQHGVSLGRLHGGDVRINIVNSKTKANLLLSPLGTAWSATLNPLVECFASLYSHNCISTVTGYANTVDHKARIGGATAGSSGLSGATDSCKIYLDIGGTSDVSDILAVDSGGNTLRRSELSVTNITASTIPSDFFAVAKLNSLIALGSYGTSLIPGNIRFPATPVLSTDPNVLDDYEEGTWTPILADTSLSDEGATYALRRGTYTKIGNRVYFSCFIQMSGLGTLTAGDAASIIGLPFTSSSTSGDISSVDVGFGSSLTLSAAATLNARVGSTSAHITLAKWLATSTAGNVDLLISDISASGILVLSGHYIV